MTYLLPSRSFSANQPPIVSHGSITLTQCSSSIEKDTTHHNHSLLTRKLNGFKNPWKSFHKPTLWEVASGASMKKIEEGVHTVDERDPVEVAEETLELVQPSWGKGTTDAQTSERSVNTNDENEREVPQGKRPLRTTWLGHAGALVQIPFGTSDDSQAASTINILVDPIFSDRASPAQSAGPARIVKSPCTVDDLPPIHILIVSHNHYDHMDLSTILGVYKKEGDNIHIFAPLGNKSYLVSQGINSEQVTECDWWDEYDFTLDDVRFGNAAKQTGGTRTSKEDRQDPEVAFPPAEPLLKITCTPAQHNSGRWGVDSNASLWSSWYFRSWKTSATSETSEPEFRVYFAGDTGLRYRDRALKHHQWETCPIFFDIAAKLGTPDLSLLPISVGGTLPYVKSWDPAPAGYSLVPDIPEALTSSTHMSPGDAVDLHRILMGQKLFESPEPDEREERDPEVEEMSPTEEGEGAPPTISPPAPPGRKRTVSLAIHFGTFCSGPAESRDTVRTLRRECKERGVGFMKLAGREGVVDKGDKDTFVVVDHGGTVSIQV